LFLDIEILVERYIVHWMQVNEDRSINRNRRSGGSCGEMIWKETQTKSFLEVEMLAQGYVVYKLLVQWTQVTDVVEL
jgi:hypothetical protein